MKINFNTHQPNFKSNLTFDIGGSQREGSCKIYYATTEKDEPIFTENTTVNNLGKNKFVDGDDFISLLIAKIKRIQKATEQIIKNRKYPEKENLLKNLAIFLPSYTSNNRAFYLPNYRNFENKALKDVDFTNLKEKLVENGIKIAPDMQFKILQDALGTGLAMTKKLYENDMLKEGRYYTACITGGGCGISNIEVVDKDKVVIKSSGSSCLSQSLALQKVSKAGASAPALIENFCKAMGFNDEIIEDIKACQKAEFTLSETVNYPKNVKTEKLKKKLLETKHFIVTYEDDENFTLKVKDEHKEKFDTARRNAIDKYCLALARLAIIKKNEGSNGMIVTGTVAKAVNKAGEENYGCGVGQWVMQHLAQSFNSFELDKMQDTYQFEVMCDERFFIDNNTECREFVHLAEPISADRGNWLKLDMKNLKPNNQTFEEPPIFC